MQDRSASAGFTLIEVLVATAVVAIVMTAVYSVWSTSLNAMSASERYIAATQIAESKIALVRSGAAGKLREDSGETDNGFVWSWNLRPMATLDEPGKAALTIVPHEISVEVSWTDGLRRRNVSLKSFRLSDGS